jgi:hypothetical protein
MSKFDIHIIALPGGKAGNRAHPAANPLHRSLLQRT